MPPFHLAVLVLAAAFLIAFVQIGLLTIAFGKLGLSPSGGMLLLLASLLGSMVNVPLFRIEARVPSVPPIPLLDLLQIPHRRLTGKTIIAINLGGGVIPIVFSLYLLQQNPLSLGQVILTTGLVAAASYLVSRPSHGVGITMPIFVAPLSAALLAILANPELSAPLAYICGTLGVLIGADLLRLRDIRDMGTPFASIGGAGTFDGIFLTGLVAALLA